MVNGILQFAVLGTGGGSTIGKLIEACNRFPECGINIALVISSDPAAGLMQRAADLGIEDIRIRVEPRSRFAEGPEGRAQYGKVLEALFMLYHIDYFALLGFLPMMPDNIIRRWPGWGQHPGNIDPPRLGFGGKGMHGIHVHAATGFFARHCGRPFMTAATAFLVSPGAFDEGSVIGRTELLVPPKATPEEIGEMVLPHEHVLQVEQMFRLAPLVRDGRALDSYGLALTRPEPLILPGEEKLFHEAIAYGRAYESAH